MHNAFFPRTQHGFVLINELFKPYEGVECGKFQCLHDNYQFTTSTLKPSLHSAANLMVTLPVCSVSDMGDILIQLKQVDIRAPLERYRKSGAVDLMAQSVEDAVSLGQN